jgi:hypothetical protein
MQSNNVRLLRGEFLQSVLFASSYIPVVQGMPFSPAV